MVENMFLFCGCADFSRQLNTPQMTTYQYMVSHLFFLQMYATSRVKIARQITQLYIIKKYFCKLGWLLLIQRRSKVNAKKTPLRQLHLGIGIAPS